MNIFLVPYTWQRHLQVALITGAAGLLAWWFVMSWFTFFGPFWSLEWDGALFLATCSGMIGGAAVLAEGSLRRRALPSRLALTLTAAGISFGVGFAGYWLWTFALGPALFGAVPDSIDSALVSLRYRLGGFVIAGIGSALGPLVTRKFKGGVTQLLSGAAAGLFGGAVWHLCNFTIYYDLYLASALGAFTWGFGYGVLAWGIPDELYAGWLRVLSPSRYGLRIPVDAMDRSPKERFVGHFPRGLDVWLNAEGQVMELHLSVAVDGEQHYKARGLTLQPTVVRRFLERIDLRYDPRRPAPLETRLSSGDRVVLGQGDQATTLEFIMLPREER
ncbi:MAG: hypothetical protein IPN01_29750 [Deltaproteobacteria bacterium]|nr:hypothetical protein [Deltaproteobacteria bacterium]